MLKRFWQISLVLLVGCGILLIVGAVYQQLSLQRDAGLHPPIGELVDVGGYHLHIHCMGEGDTTLIVDTGAADWSLSWLAIQDDLAQLTRTCVYDRAGLGWSEASPSARHSQDLVDELHRLLTHANIEPPYILLGHSLGGYNARLYYQQYPDDVVGIILLESAHPEQWGQLPTEVEDLVVEQSNLLGTMGLLTNVGLVRFILPEHLHLHDEYQPMYQAHMARSRHLVASGQEIAGGIISAEQASQTEDLGDLPLVVTTAEHSFDAFRDFTDNIPFEEADATWLSLQADLATLSSNSLHLVSPTADHNIHLTDPAIVIDSVRQLLAMLEGA